MIDILSISNRILRSKGNIIQIEFEILGKKFKAFVPDDQLFVAVKDVLLNREYEYLPDFELIDFMNKRIVDAGAHVGLFSLVASNFAKEVISIEPHPINFKLLEINIIENNVKNIIPINKALWHREAIVNFYQGEHSGSGTLFPSLKKPMYKRYLVPSITLREIIESFGEIHLLKLDIEGSEFEIFEKNEDILKNIEHIVAEIHLTRGNLSSILRVLSLKGFNFHIFYPPLIKKNAKYEIKVKDLVGLKIWRSIVYTISSLARIKEKTLIILFAKKI